MGLLSGFKKFTIGAAKLIAPIGESVGSALAVPEAKRLEDQKTQNELKVRQLLIDRVRTEKDPIKKERLLKIANRSVSEKNQGIIESVDAFQERPLQTFAKAGITVANIALLGKAPKSLGFLRTKAAADFIAGAHGVKKVTTAAKIARGASIAAKDFGIGSGFGTLFALEKGERDPKKIAKEALTIGGISAVLPPVVGKTLGLSGRAISKGAKVAGKGLEKGITKLEALAEKPFVKPQNALDEFINVAHGTKQTPLFKNVVAKGAEFGRGLQNLPSRLKIALLDRMSPFRDLSKQVTEITGKPVSFVDDPYQQARRTQGIIDGKFNQEAKSLFTNIVNDFPEVELEAQGYLAAKNALDRINLGQKVVRGLNKEQAQEAIRLAEASDKFPIIQGYEQSIQKVRDRIMDIRLQSGLIDEKTAETLRKTHPNYVPNKVLDFFEEGGTTVGDLVKPSGTKFSVTESGIKKAKGSEREIMNPVEAMIVELKKAITDSERNNVANKVIGVAENNNVTKELGFEKINKLSEFKNFDDFIKSQKELFRGDVLKPFDVNNVSKNRGVSFTESRSLAFDFADSKKSSGQEEDFISNFFISPKAKILEEKNIPNILKKEASEATRNFIKSSSEDNVLEKIMLEKQQKIITFAKNNNFDGVRIPGVDDLDELETVILNTDVLKTESQMKDIFNNIKKIIQPKEVDLKAQGLEKVSRYVNGVKEDWLVPRDIGAAMKNLDVKELGTVGKLLSIPTQILKAGATRFNPDFIFRNPARDIQTAKITSSTGLSGKDWVKILLQSKGKSAELLKAAETEGALLSGLIQKENTPKAVLNAIDNSITIKKVAKEYNPLSIIEKVGEKFENNTRLAVFKGGVDQGLSPAEAAFNARNASIDFSKMGNVTAVINKFIPFLNARIQGFSNIGTALKRDPTKFVREQLWTAAYPTMLLNSHNNNFESYKNIPQRTKDQHWIIMIDEEDGTDEGGNPIKVPNAIRIPKGESQAAVANTLDHFLDFAKDRDVRTYKELVGDLAQGISPVAGVSAIGPLTAPLELSTNFDLFKKKKIVPDFISVGGKSFDSKELEDKHKFTKYSTETAKRIGQQFDISPAKIDFINQKLFGGLGPTIFKSLDIAEEGFAPKAGIEAGAKLSTFEKMAQTPVLKGFLTTSNYGGIVKDIELADKIGKEISTPEFIQRQQATILWETLKKLPKEEANDIAREMKEEDPRMFNRLKDIKEDEKQGLNSTERLIKNLGVSSGERALFIVEQLNMIDTKEGKNQIFKNWKDKKLITDQVMKQIKHFKETGRLKSPEED